MEQEKKKRKEINNGAQERSDPLAEPVTRSVWFITYSLRADVYFHLPDLLMMWALPIPTSSLSMIPHWPGEFVLPPKTYHSSMNSLSSKTIIL